MLSNNSDVIQMTAFQVVDGPADIIIKWFILMWDVRVS